jgi:hypothetical protein
LPAEKQDDFRCSFLLARQASATAIGAQRARTQDNTWDVWVRFCNELTVDPLLDDVQDPLIFLEVFAQRSRDGTLAKDGYAVRARTVKDAIRAVGQTMANLGSKDKRLDSTPLATHTPALAVCGKDVKNRSPTNAC